MLHAILHPCLFCVRSYVEWLQYVLNIIQDNRLQQLHESTPQCASSQLRLRFDGCNLRVG